MSVLGYRPLSELGKVFDRILSMRNERFMSEIDLELAASRPVRSAFGRRRSDHLRSVASDFRLRVLFVDSDEFLHTVLTESLEGSVDLCAVHSVGEALDVLSTFDPHAVVADLDSDDDASGLDLFGVIARTRPWVGRVLLTSDASHVLAIGRDKLVPPGTMHLIKSELLSAKQVRQAVSTAIKDVATPGGVSTADDVRIGVTEAQARTLGLIAKGMSNAAICKELDLAHRSVERLVRSALDALALGNDADVHPRVSAAMMMRSGRIYVE